MTAHLIETCHTYVQGNPLAAESFETLVDISEYSCAMCLCDRLWVDPDADSSNGVDFMEERDMLRLDSMLLLVQLHIRYALQAQVRSPPRGCDPACALPRTCNGFRSLVLPLAACECFMGRWFRRRAI